MSAPVAASLVRLCAIRRCHGRPSNRHRPCVVVCARLKDPPRVVEAGWAEANVAAGAHDTVLAATMPAFFEQPEAFLARCRAWARNTIVWVVPAHAGPRGLCFCGMPAVRMASGRRDARHRYRDAGIVVGFAAAGSGLRRLDVLRDRAGPRPARTLDSRAVSAGPTQTSVVLACMHISLARRSVPTRAFVSTILRRTAVLVWGNK